MGRYSDGGWRPRTITRIIYAPPPPPLTPGCTDKHTSCELARAQGGVGRGVPAGSTMHVHEHLGVQPVLHTHHAPCGSPPHLSPTHIHTLARPLPPPAQAPPGPRRASAIAIPATWWEPRQHRAPALVAAGGVTLCRRSPHEEAMRAGRALG